MHDCHICYEDAGKEILINTVYTCATCINKLVRSVVDGRALYPVMINNEPADLTEHRQYLDRNLFDRYAQMEQQESIPPHLRVYCAKEHFVGEQVKTTARGIYLTAISQCNKCQCATCMICKKQLDKDAPLTTIVDHGCKAQLAADEKLRAHSFEGLVRGKDYQFCPTCKRDIQLEAVCHHIACLCTAHLCYQCGELAKPKDGHYELGQCTLYPVVPNLPAPAVGAAPAIRFDVGVLYRLRNAVLAMEEDEPDEVWAYLDGQIYDLDLEHVVTDEALLSLREDILAQSNLIAVMDQAQDLLPPDLRSDGRERAVEIKRLDELHRERAEHRFRRLQEIIQGIDGQEVDALHVAAAVHEEREDDFMNEG